MPTLINDDALANAKTDAITWVHQQSWINHRIITVVEKAIDELPSWHSPASNATLYRNIRADIKELSHWLDVTKLQEPISTASFADKEVEILCLCAEMIIYIAMLPDHTIPNAMVKHPFKEQPENSLIVSWWAMLCDELTHLINNNPYDNYIFLHIVLSKSASKATHTQHKQKNKKLHKLLKHWENIYKKNRIKTPVKDKEKKDKPIDAAYTMSSSPKRKAEKQGALLPKKRVTHLAQTYRAISEDDDEQAVVDAQKQPSFQQLKAERDAAQADAARMRTQIQSFEQKYTKYKQMSKELNGLLVQTARLHTSLMSKYQQEDESSHQMQKEPKQQISAKQQEIEPLDSEDGSESGISSDGSTGSESLAIK